MPVDFLTNDRAGATLRPLRRRAPTPRTSSVFPHWLHEFINMYRRYYFGLTERRCTAVSSEPSENPRDAIQEL